MPFHSRATRAWRRHDRARLKAVRARHQSRAWRTFATPQDEAASLGQAVATATPCSCPMCGNPRRSFGHRTRAEEKAALDQGEGVEEWWDGVA